MFLLNGLLKMFPNPKYSNDKFY